MFGHVRPRPTGVAAARLRTCHVTGDQTARRTDLVYIYQEGLAVVDGDFQNRCLSRHTRQWDGEAELTSGFLALCTCWSRAYRTRNGRDDC